MLFQLGVGVARKHLAVRVDVDARASSLLKQGLEVAHVVARDEDGLALDGGGAHGGGLGDAQGLDVCLLEQLHDSQVGAAQCQALPQHSVGIVGVGGAEKPIVRLFGTMMVVFWNNTP